MGAVLEGMFINPSTLPGGAECLSHEHGYCDETWYGLIKVLGLAAVYGFVLSHGSSLISDGAELLQVVPWLEQLVGSIVLPVLGAVPDGAIILFSGLTGERSRAQEQLSVGVGTLAGSTVLLITLPWAMSVVAGRVELGRDGAGLYRRPHGWSGPWHKVTTPLLSGLRSTGVSCEPAVLDSARAMGATALLYLLIQIPAMTRSFRSRAAPSTDEEALAVAAFERPWAICTLVVALLAFCAYLVYKALGAHSDPVLVYHRDQIRIAMIQSGELTLMGAMAHLVDRLDHHDKAASELVLPPTDDLRAPLAPLVATSSTTRISPGGGGNATAGSAGGIAGQATGQSAQQLEAMHELRETLRPFFQRYDYNGSGGIDGTELRVLFMDLHEKLDEAEIRAFAEHFRTSLAGAEASGGAHALERGSGGGGGGGLGDALDGRGEVSFDLFVQVVIAYIRRRGAALKAGGDGEGFRAAEARLLQQTSGEQAAREPSEAGEDESEAGEEMPEDLRDLEPSEQYRRAISKAGRMLLGGTALVVLFSEPMCGVLSEMATRTGVPAFYVAFVLAPAASNGAEVLSAYTFSKRKSVRASTISFSTLLGAAVMNNTFCLAIFMALIVYRGDLYWEYTAETISILVVEACVLWFAMKPNQRVIDGLLVGLLYPLGLALVVGLEAAGFD